MEGREVNGRGGGPHIEVFAQRRKNNPKAGHGHGSGQRNCLKLSLYGEARQVQGPFLHTVL